MAFNFFLNMNGFLWYTSSIKQSKCIVFFSVLFGVYWWRQEAVEHVIMLLRFNHLFRLTLEKKTFCIENVIRNMTLESLKNYLELFKNYCFQMRKLSVLTVATKFWFIWQTYQAIERIRTQTFCAQESLAPQDFPFNFKKY